jgi:hypothetical protein
MATGVDAKLLKSTKFPPIFNQKVDTQKVNLQVMKKYGLDAPSLFSTLRFSYNMLIAISRA